MITVSTHSALGQACGRGAGGEIRGRLGHGAPALSHRRGAQRDGAGSSGSCGWRTLFLNCSGLWTLSLVGQRLPAQPQGNGVWRTCRHGWGRLSDLPAARGVRLRRRVEQGPAVPGEL